ncbi:MAG: response regulator [Anaerolineae bacterium]|nr:response regulator [Anaerolineae bacterium]
MRQEQQLPMTTRILVIEDEVSLLEEVLEWLHFEGYDAMGAVNGHEGVSLALRQPPDLVVSDVMMPEMDGYRVLIEMRSHVETQLVPFIFMTARVSRGDVRYGMDLGADDYVTKPFSREELLSAIHSRLARRETVKDYVDSRMEGLRRNLIHTLPHELRTPLVAILGYGDLLSTDAESFSPSKVAEMGAMIYKSGKRLHELIENYLLYAQIETTAIDSAKLHALQETVTEHPDKIISKSAQMVAKEYIRTSDLSLNLNTGLVGISDNNLAKITHELVDNAFKFSASGTPVAIDSGYHEGFYCLAVSDQGRGISSEHVANIGAYNQFERSIYEQQGLGQGLIISKRLAEIHRGEMHIDTALGVGTTVRILLPAG